MSATDESLRKMLDERGVEWWKASPRKTKWHSPVLGGPVAVSEWNGKMVLDVGYVNVTPEQAIAATLGDADATGERQRDAVEVVRCRDCERFAVDQSDHDYRTGWWCKRWYTDMVKPDGFCAWACRKEQQ